MDFPALGEKPKPAKTKSTKPKKYNPIQRKEAEETPH